MDNCCFVDFSLGFDGDSLTHYLRRIPKRGPILNVVVARYLLETACSYNVDPFLVKFPSIVRVGKGKYHVNVDIKSSLFNVVSALLHDPNGLCGMDSQTMIEQASMVNASTIAVTEANKQFRTCLQSKIVIRTKLTPEQQKTVCDEVPNINLKFAQEQPVLNDHAELVALREIVRTEYSRFAKPKTTSLRSLIIGTSMREVTAYWENSNIYFQYNGVEAKDVTRFALDVMEKIGKTVARRAKKSGKENLIIRANKADDIVNAGVATGVLMERFDQDYSGQYNQILLEDVGYNWVRDDWINVFRRTGASVAYGYMMLPWELIFPDVVGSRIYDYRERSENFSTFSSVTFKYNNGYYHWKEAWQTLLKYNVMHADDFSLVVEIKVRCGPMCVFSVSKVVGATNETIVRNLQLPSHMHPAKILDLKTCTNVDGKINKKLTYISMRRNEYDDLMNYMLSLDEKSLKFQNIVTYVRRKIGGVSTISNTIIRPWQLPVSAVDNVCVTVLLHAQQEIFRTSVIYRNLDIGSKREKWMSMFRTWARDSFPNIANIVDFLSKGHLDGKLVVNIPCDIIQYTKLRKTNDGSMVFTVERDVEGQITNSDDNVICDICEYMTPCLGSQKLKCYKGDGVHKFALTKNEISEFSERLSETQNDSMALADLKTKAKTVLPPDSFETEDIRVVYLRGGPGSGKSRMIRQMATVDDLIVVPFSKLKSEYRDAGLTAVTQHNAMMKQGHQRIFVDEFTALPYEFLATIVHRNATQVVFLVGDLGQTGTIHNVEGISMTAKISFDTLGHHELTKNFRNPDDTVAVINHFYGYEMESVSSSIGYRFRHLDMWDPKQPITPLCFTKLSAQTLGFSSDSTIEKVTVRANQGTTHDSVGLFFTAHDSNVASLDCMNVVAFTRHRQRCVVYYDDSSSAQSTVGKYKSFFDGYVDNLVKPPTKNFCLLTALVKLLSHCSKTLFTVEDLWRNFVSVVGVSEAITVRNSMLTEKHLDLLANDLEVSVILLRDGVSSEVFGSGRPIGQLRLKNNHYDVHSVCSRWVPQIFPVTTSQTSAVASTSKCVCSNKDVVKNVFGGSFSWRPTQSVRGLFNVECYATSELLVPIKFLSYTFLCGKFDKNLLAVVSRSNIKLTNSTVCIVINTVCPDLIIDIDQVKFVNYLFIASTLDIRGDWVCPDQTKNVVCETGDGLQFDCITGHQLVLKNLKRGTNLVLFTEISGRGNKVGSYPLAGGDSTDDTDNRDIPSFEQNFVDHIEMFAEHEPGFPVVVEKDVVDVDVRVPLEQTPADSYLLLKESFDKNFGSVSQFTNEEAAMTIGDQFSKGIMNVNFLDEINLRGHPVDNRINFYCISRNGPGLYYHQKSKWQQLQCLEARYLCKNMAAECDIVGVGIAHEIADLFVNEHMDVSMSSLTMDDVNNTTLDSMRAMRTKKYEQQVSLVDGGLNCDIVRFHMKDIFKPFKDKVDIYKAGQGISAWSKETQSMFQTGCRIINIAFMRCLKPHVLYDNLVSEQDMLVRANNLLSSLPEVCSNGVIDATACDSGQNKFTQAIERRILVRMGVDPCFIEWYYRFREEYKLVSRVVTAKIEGIKTSGEPATLLCNTILMMALMNSLLRGEGPCVLLGKGDDGLKRQGNLKYNSKLVERFSKYTKLQFRVDIDQPVNFCGYSLVGSALYPCILRKAQKISGHKFRDYGHFREYQQSLRDWILLVNKLGIEETVETTSRFSTMSITFVWSLFHAIQSISHIDCKQFLEFFEYVSICVDCDIPTHENVGKQKLNFSSYL